MAKLFREWKVEQAWLLPPSVQELVPPGNLAHFVRDTVREGLDLSAILDTYTEERGYPPYHPAMLVALLLYGYCQGIYSSRRMARACEERVDFMAVTAMQKPDFRTISDFRKRHLKALGSLFGQVLKLCQHAGLVKLGHVALDGTKVKANASKRKAMSYGRMKKAEQELAAEIAKWFAEAEQTDRREDVEHGSRRGDEMPEWVANKVKRLQMIREAKAALEAEARAALEAETKAAREAEATAREAGPETSATVGTEAEAAAPEPEPPPEPPTGGGAKPSAGPTAATPDDKAQRNFTDADSRIMKTSDGFIQGFNAQAAVDADHQIIVAQEVVNAHNDAPRLIPMLNQIGNNTGTLPDELSADCGYLSEQNLANLKQRRVRAYIATGRQRHGEKSATGRSRTRGPLAAEMRLRLKRAGHRSRYRLRKQIVEPVFGQAKEARGFRRFLLRGMEKVPHEWSLVCTAHNLLKLAKRSPA